jgi:outer membrane protein assembly complex protein YaeT
MHRLLPALLFASAALGAVACNEEGVVRVNSLDFQGVRSVDVDLLKSSLATREQDKIPVLGIRLPWSKSRSFFDRGRFDADLKRIEAFYADRGFPEARVTSFDVELNDEQDAVDVSLTIEEGDPVLVSSVAFVGFDSLPADHLATLSKQKELEVGRPRARQAVLAVHELAVNELRDHGYPYARVTTAEDDGPEGHEAAITFTAVPGPLAHFGPIEIAGNQSVGDSVIRRQLTIAPGDLYRRSAVQDSQRRLYSMELFQFVNVEALNPELQNPEVPTRVTVAEGKHQRFNAGVGYGTEEHGRVDGEYKHVNFLGGARTAGAHARRSSRDRGIRLNFNQPYFFAPRLSLGADAQRWYTYTPAYRSVVTGAKIALTHRRSARTSWTVSLSSERSNSLVEEWVLEDPMFLDDLIALGLDPTTNRQEGTLSAAGFDWQISTADDLLNATRGYQIALHLEEAGRLLPGTFNYYSVSGDLRHYLPVHKDVVIANRLQFGNISAAGNDPTQVPFSRKYFLGGATSLRGWGRFEVSPLAGQGFPIGGNTLLALSTEVRARLKGNFGGVLFADAGNVWATDGGPVATDQQSVSLKDLRYDVGAGLRYQTPIGPIRFDLGYQLNEIPGLLVDGKEQQRPWRLHFSIGQAF